MLPGRAYSPAQSLPETVSGSLCAENVQPPASMAFMSAPSGRSGSRPCPTAEKPPQTAAATGRRKRSVEPLSPQSSTGACGVSRMGETAAPPASQRTAPPSAVTQRTVACMSSEGSPLRMSCVGLSASAAQMSARCASDLDGIAATAPASRAGYSFKFIFLHHRKGRGQARLPAFHATRSRRCALAPRARWYHPCVFCRKADRA